MSKLEESHAVKTAMKQINTADGKISRDDFERIGAHERDNLKHLNPMEAENVYKIILKFADIYGLDKFEKDGGLRYSMREYEIARRILGKRDLPDLVRQLQGAHFRAIDTNGDGVIRRNEWINYLKICKTYTTNEEAIKAFDSIDKNKNGAISLPEFTESAVDFWCSSGEALGVQNMYGTKNL